VLAYEINCRLIDGLRYHDRGWTHGVQPTGVALAAGKLMKLLRAACASRQSRHQRPIPMAQPGSRRCPTGRDSPTPEAGATPCSRTARARRPDRPGAHLRREFGFLQADLRAGRRDVAAFGRRGGAVRIHQCGIKAYRPWSTRRPRSWPASRSPRKRAPRPHRGDRNRDDEARLPARRERAREVDAGHAGDRRSQPAYITGARHVSTATLRTTATCLRSSASRASSPSCARSR